MIARGALWGAPAGCRQAPAFLRPLRGRRVQLPGGSTADAPCQGRWHAWHKHNLSRRSANHRRGCGYTLDRVSFRHSSVSSRTVSSFVETLLSLRLFRNRCHECYRNVLSIGLACLSVVMFALGPGSAKKTAAAFKGSLRVQSPCDPRV